MSLIIGWPSPGLIWALRAYFLTRIGVQIIHYNYTLIFQQAVHNFDDKTIHNLTDLDRTSWSYCDRSLEDCNSDVSHLLIPPNDGPSEAARLAELGLMKYLLINNCQSMLPLLGISSIVSAATGYIHSLFYAFMSIADATPYDTGRKLCGLLFFLLCLKCDLMGLPDEQRFWKLLQNFLLIGIVVLDGMHGAIKDRLTTMGLSHSQHRSQKRAIIVALVTIITLTMLNLHLLLNHTINSWSLTVVIFSFDTINRMLTTMLVYTIIINQSKLNWRWNRVDRAVTLLNSFSNVQSSVCSLALFIKSLWVIFNENCNIVTILSLILYAYRQLWCQLVYVYHEYSKRRAAQLKISGLLDASDKQLREHNDICPICYEPLKQAAKVTQCYHYFHANCLVKWLNYQDACPLCFRTIIQLDKQHNT